MLKRVIARRLTIGPALLILLSGCGESSPSCDEQSVLETVERLIIQTSGAYTDQKDLGCYGPSGCVPFVEGDRLQFHTLVIDPGAARNRGRIPENAITQKITFSISKSDFLKSINFQFQNVRTMARDSETKKTSCAADLAAKLDFSIFQGKLPGEVVQNEGFDGHQLSSYIKEYRTTGLKLLESTYRTIRWNNPVQYDAQRTSDGKIYVTLTR